MGARIRAFDWASTPLGAIEGWPPSLRTVVDLMLASRHPIYIAWGPQLISLFNDGYLPIVGNKHPGALGLSYWELWSEVSADYRSLVESVMAGEGQLFIDAPFPLRGRPGVPMSWFTFSWTPIRDESGQVAGFFCVAIETTRKVVSEAYLQQREARQALLVQLGDALLPLVEPAAILREASRLLAERLDVDRAYYVEIDEETGAARVAQDFVRDGSPSLVGDYRVTDFGWSVAILRSGECHVVADTQSSPLVPAADRPASARLGIVACMGAPLIKEGRLVGALCVTSGRPRAWSDDEVSLLREVGERIWSAVERARAEAALQQAHDELERRVVERTAELARVNAELRAEAHERRRAEAERATLQRQLATAQEDERKRIARDLHDQTGQLLASLSLAVAAVTDVGPLPSEAAGRLALVQRVADELGRQVHELAVRLRPVALDDLGLPVALRELVDGWSARTGVPVDLQTVRLEPGRLPAEVETVLYRVVQEALTNVAKHAHARLVSVVVARHDAHVTAVIEDDGQGFDPSVTPRGRLGLVSMRERLDLIGGHLDIESTIGAGTTVIARAPSSIASLRPPSTR